MAFPQPCVATYDVEYGDREIERGLSPSLIRKFSKTPSNIFASGNFLLTGFGKGAFRASIQNGINGGTVLDSILGIDDGRQVLVIAGCASDYNSLPWLFAVIRQTPVLHVSYIKDCIASQQLLPYAGYVLLPG